jgi:protein O-mannosyl-transferase
MNQPGMSQVEPVPPRPSCPLWRRLLLRPSVWIAVISVIAYWDEKPLNGGLVYDDGGSLLNNVVVNGQVPWHEVWRRDFWGTLMSAPASHKSYRPITTLTFKLNWALAGPDPTKNTFGFHAVNYVLHGIVTALVTETMRFVFPNALSPQIIAGAIFGLHPVHTEAVTNITSRGELIMSLFYLTAFLSYAASLRASSFPIRVVGIYLVPWICMTASVFSKEQGATALITCVLYDFIHRHWNVKRFLERLWDRDAESLWFLWRALVLAVETLLILALRYYVNGESSPDFIFDQNPAGFSKDRFTRAFSVSWVYCLYIFDAVYPKYLAPDWSGVGIKLIERAEDPRVYNVLLLWLFAAICLSSLLHGRVSESRRVVLLAFFAFTFSPFLLSSNILVVVGLMKADRVIYLPLWGFAVLEAHLFDLVTRSKMTSVAFWIGYILVLGQLLWFGARLHERNLAWSNSLDLWLSAYQINNRSHHTMYNCGYELSTRLRYAESEQVMRPIGNPHVDGPSNTFVYAMVLYNLNRCDEANPLIDKALAIIAEQRAIGGIRNTKNSLDRSQSNILVARAYCTISEDLRKAGRVFYEAVQVDQTNKYAVEQAVMIMKKIEEAESMVKRGLS